MNKKIIWGIVIAIIIIGGGLAYGFLSKPKLVCWPYCPGMTDQDREAIKKSALEAETANWKTYKNDEYGFEFKYPSELISQESYENTNVKEGTKVKLSLDSVVNQNPMFDTLFHGILKNEDESGFPQVLNFSVSKKQEWLDLLRVSSLESYVNDFGKKKDATAKKIKIGTASAFMMTQKNLRATDVEIFFERPENFISFSYYILLPDAKGNLDKNETLLNQTREEILSTFKFTK